jgi:hypothetical protein
MKKLLLLILLITINCVSSPTASWLFTNTDQHIYDRSHGTTITSAKVEKMGKSCSMSGFLINIFYYGGGGSIEEAKYHGKIKKIATIDRSSLTVLPFLYHRECIIVWGE